MTLPNIYVFKDLKIKYAITVICGIILIPLIIGLLTSSETVAIVSIFVWIFVCATIFEIIKNKRLDKINTDLDECRIHSYVNSYEVLSENCSKKNNYILSNLAVGYIKLGDFERAYALLKLVDIKPTNNIAILTGIFFYYNNLFLTCAELDKLEEANQNLLKMLEIINLKLVRNNVYYYNTFLRYYRSCSLVYKAKTGEYDANEVIYETLLETEAKLIEKVCWHFGAAEITFKKGDFAKASNHYKFVAENGGDTYYCIKAKERLAEILQ